LASDIVGSVRHVGRTLVLALLIASCGGMRTEAKSSQPHGGVVPDGGSPPAAVRDDPEGQAAAGAPPEAPCPIANTELVGTDLSELTRWPVALTRALLTVIRDPRRQRMKAGAAPISREGLAGLQRMLDGMRPTSPDRPGVIRRLAQAHDELALDIELRPLVYPELRCIGAGIEQARAEAMRWHETLLREYPAYSKNDEVLYSLGLDNEMQGALGTAREQYRSLVERYPKSPYATLARLAEVELDLGDMVSASDFHAAIASYRRVLRSPCRGCASTCAQGLADYRIAELEWLVGRRRESRRTLKRIVQTCRFRAIASLAEQNLEALSRG
jgi:hypothetical protein